MRTTVEEMLTICQGLGEMTHINPGKPNKYQQITKLFLSKLYI